MASFLSRLFGRSGAADIPAPASGATELYGDCLIRAAPIKDGGQYRLAGSIEKEVDGTTRVRTFIRADTFPGLDEASGAAVRKAHQIIDQNGSSLFADGAETRPV